MNARKTQRTLALACTLALSTLAMPSLASSETHVEWSSDIQASLKQASESKSSTLLLLTHAGEEPLTETDVQAARAAFGGDLELAQLTWPKDPKLAQAEAKHFLRWADRYETRALPTALLLDAKGRVFAELKTETLETDCAAGLAAASTKLQARDRALTAAEQMKGLERAKALDEALTQVPVYINVDYRDIAQEIVELSREEEPVLYARYRQLLAKQDLDEYIQGTVYPLIDAGNYPAARSALDQVLTAWPIDMDTRQMMLGFQAQLYYSEGDKDKALAMLDNAIAVQPDSDAAEKLSKARDQIAELPVPE